MARKFSLKNNPIFQRLHVPQPKDVRFLEPAERTADYGGQVEFRTNANEGQNQTLKNRPSKIDSPDISFEEEKHETGLKDDSSQRVNADAPEQNLDIEIIEDFPNIEDQNLTLNSRPSKFTPQSNEREASESAELVPKAPAIEQDDIRESQPQSYELQNLYVQQTAPDVNKIESNFDAQNLTVKKTSSKTHSVLKGRTKNRQVQAADPILGQGKFSPVLKDNFDKSLFFSFYNEVTDELLPLLSPAEQILYSRLFRLSYGFNRNYCTVSQPTLREKTGLSRNTIRTGIQSLVKKEWIYVIDAGNHISTTYLLVLPREKIKGSKNDPQNMSGKIRPSKYDSQNLSVNNRSSKNDRGEGQKTEVQNLTDTFQNYESSKDDEQLQPGEVKFDPQTVTPFTLTNNPLTLSRGESAVPVERNKVFLSISSQLVDNFYSLLGQQPSTTKRERGVSECYRLLRDGFSTEDIEYTINWLVLSHPNTGSFSRVVHFIDQALKAKGAEQHHSVVQDQRKAQEEEARIEQERIVEEGKK